MRTFKELTKLHKNIEVLQKTFVEMIAEGKQVDVIDFIVQHMTEGDNGKVWVHSHGMYEIFGLPDLEVRDIYPAFLAPTAVRYINHLAQYMLDGKLGKEKTKPYSVGQTFGPLPGNFIITTEISLPWGTMGEEEIDTHYATPRWNVIIHQGPPCASCGRHHGPTKDNKQHVH